MITDFQKMNELIKERNIAQAEAEKFQSMNDELIERLIFLSREGVKSNQTAVEAREKQVRDKDKLIKELRDYIAVLHAKIGNFRGSVEEIDNLKEANYKLKQENERLRMGQSQQNYEMAGLRQVRKEKEVVEKRMIELYEAMEKVEGVIGDVL